LEYGVNSALAIPVPTAERLVGVLFVASQEVDRFDAGELPLVEQAGAQVAAAIESARLRREVDVEIARRHSAEERLTRSEQRFRALFDNAPEAVFLLDPHDPNVAMRIIDCNESAARQNGYARGEMLDKPIAWLQSTPAEATDLADLVARIRAGGVLRLESRHRRKDGASVHVERALSLVRMGDDEIVLALDHDVTGRHQLEEQLRQANKMEAIGRLTGGVAHDFNNMLSVIGGYAELLLLDAAPGSEVRERAEEIKTATQRAAGLTRQLLLFSRRERPQLGPVNLNDAVSELTKMLGRLIGEDIDLSSRFDPHLENIRADISQIQQVLINLAVNARDAMPGGGRLEIETRRLVADAAVASLCPGMSPGAYTVLSVGDTGTGMDEATRLRIFDPYFTTKDAGKGTGIGLALVYGIVSQCGGFIHVYSKPGEGTIFRIYFPAIRETGSAPAPTMAPETAPGGGETVLLVEDEVMLRTMLRLSLEQLGYQVLCPSDVQEALQISLEHQGNIHLVVSDLVMPGINGRELVERIRSKRPDMRVLLMSGYTDEILLRSCGTSSGFAFIEKPFQLHALAAKVREVLDQDHAAPCGPQGNGRVLVVDDDANTRETLIDLLTEEGYRADAAADGRKALELLRNGARPDVILLDLRMPAMNGWVFRIEQRKDPAIADIPVIVLSGEHDPAAAADFLDAPDSLSKPVEVKALFSLIRKHCAPLAA